MTLGAGERQVHFDLGRAHIVGVLNATPDSFSDGGQYADREAAIRRGLEMAEAGAAIIDVGGESTRPGAAAVEAAVELERVRPVIEALAARGLTVSIDTTKAEVAAAAIEAGALLVNDIAGGRFDPRIIEVTAASDAGYVLGHVRGDSIEAVHAGESAPPTVAEVQRELADALAALPATLRPRTICDPGLGFGKPAALSAQLTQNSGALAAALQCPIMIGPSRKRFLGEITGKPTAERDDATIGAALAAVAAGARFIRVHAARRVADALAAFEACAPEAIR